MSKKEQHPKPRPATPAKTIPIPRRAPMGRDINAGFPTGPAAPRPEGFIKPTPAKPPKDSNK